MLQIIIGIVVALLAILGLVGVILPFLPGTPLILLAAVVYGFGFGFQQIGTGIYIALAILTLFSLVVDYITTSLGAKGFGASKAGMIGAALGALFGFLLGNLPGLFVGPFIGALLGETLWGKGSEGSFKAGLGAAVGVLGGMVVRFLLALAMLALLVYGIAR